MDESDARLAQPRQVQLGATAAEVVERDELPVGMPFGEPDADVGADEPGAARNEDAHLEG